MRHIALLAVLISICMASTVFADEVNPPNLPMSISAQVLIGDSPAPEGTAVEAHCENICATTSSVVLIREGEFGNGGTFDPRIDVQGVNLDVGTPITFTVDGNTSRVKYPSQDEYSDAISYVPGSAVTLLIWCNNTGDEEIDNETLVVITPTPEPTTEPIVEPTPEPTPEYLPVFSSEDQAVIDYMKTIDENYVAETANKFEFYSRYWYIHDYQPNVHASDCRIQRNPSMLDKFDRMFRYAECGGYKPRPDLDAMLEAQNYGWFKIYGINWTTNGWTRVPYEWVGLYGLPSMYVPSEGIVKMCECPPDGVCC